MSIMITGSPGVGKHTIAIILAEQLRLDIVDVNDIAIKNSLVNSEGIVNVDELCIKLKKNINNNNIIVGHLAPYALQTNQISAAIVLRKSPYSLENIYTERGYTYTKSLENLGAEILGVIVHDTIKQFGKNITYQIDNTINKPKDTAILVKRALDTDYVGDDIDWLTKVKDMGDMQRFFSY